MTKPIAAFSLLFMLFIVSCQQHYIDVEPENYDSLFPIGDIEKPDIAYEDMVHNPCNIDQYEYPGVMTIASKRTYNVVVECQFEQGTSTPPFFDVAYVDLSQQLRRVTSYSNKLSNQVMKPGVPVKVEFQLPSGYPMYLSVKGNGGTNSSIRASIVASSNDGVIELPKIQYEATQSKIGSYEIIPFCEYIILP